jgi:hypothetical protein
VILALALASALHAQALFEERPAQRVCGEGLGWARSFEAPRDCSATVSIRRLEGLTREHDGEARLWLDDTLLGPLRREFGGGGWESVEPVALKAGRHALSIECGAEAFEMEGVRVGTPDSGASVAAKPAPPSTPAAPAGVALTHTPEPFFPFQPCPDLAVNTGWPHLDPRHAILLSVLNGRAASSGVLADLQNGQRLRWWFKISPRPNGPLHFPPILLSELRIEGRRWALQFSVDHEEMARIKAERRPSGPPAPLGYRPGRWTPLDLALCADGSFHLSTNNGEVGGDLKVPEKDMAIEVWSREIEIAVKGANP